jgi:O-antigen ligase
MAQAKLSACMIKQGSIVVKLMTQQEPSSLKARNTLTTLFVALSVLDAILVPISRDWYSIGRILLTIVVMFFVLHGAKWAKWLLIAICSLVAVLLIAMVIKLSAKLSILLIAGSLMLVVLNTFVVIYLAVSKDLNLYLSGRKA